ncbi:TonB-dependent receptor plug domain-containing protein [Sphingomonas sp.]|uniref:TonB-dependent receptor plug domain-containing protein n=1 Tax=Sphingomonas sp. TaxID=28214 RepID=UPI002DD66DF6|nr:TonB-dependent receptor plug domain-containing protein [Sphingomonas sp.]
MPLLALAFPAAAQETRTTGSAAPPAPREVSAQDGAAPVTDRQVYTPADFARYAPRTAYDMLQRIPGFQIRDSEQLRGLGQATGNVLFNGERPSNKSDTMFTQLSRIPAATVERIEVVDGGTLQIPGLSGQVANVVFRAAALTGQFSWRPQFRVHNTDPLVSRANISVSGRSGPLQYQIGLDNDQASRSGADGLTLIYDGAGAVIERRDDVWTNDDDSPKVSGRFTLDGPGNSVAHLNAHYQRTYSRYNEDGLRSLPGQADRLRTVRDRELGWNYEIGGDYEFGLGPGRLKLVGLRRYNFEPFTQTILVDYLDATPTSGERFSQTGRVGETIARGEYGWKMLGGDWQWSAEAAYNTLDSVTSVGALDASGRFVDTPFPGGTGGVDEDRYESLLSYSRPLTPQFNIQLIAGAEHSTITQTAVGGVSRSFLRPKGSLSLSWKPSADFDLSLKLRRRVLQLSFYDFLARAFLNDGNQNAGNIDLRPQQDWTVEAEANRRLGPWGSTKLRFIYRDVVDYVDIVPVGTGESAGNIAKSWASAIDWTSTIQFEPLGWKGARLDSRVLFQKSSLRDPFTGEVRYWSGFTDTIINTQFRHDIPASDWAWGGGLEYSHNQPRYRRNQTDRTWEGPIFASVFVEHKDVFGLTVRADVVNFNDARSRRERFIYAGLRGASQLLLRESRDRRIGPIFSFSVRGSF